MKKRIKLSILFLVIININCASIFIGPMENITFDENYPFQTPADLSKDTSVLNNKISSFDNRNVSVSYLNTRRFVDIEGNEGRNQNAKLDNYKKNIAWITQSGNPTLCVSDEKLSTKIVYNQEGNITRIITVLWPNLNYFRTEEMINQMNVNYMDLLNKKTLVSNYDSGLVKSLDYNANASNAKYGYRMKFSSEVEYLGKGKSEGKNCFFIKETYSSFRQDFFTSHTSYQTSKYFEKTETSGLYPGPEEAVNLSILYIIDADTMLLNLTKYSLETQYGDGRIWNSKNQFVYSFKWE